MRTLRWLILGGITLVAAGVFFDVWRRGAAPSPAVATASTEEKAAAVSSKWTGSPSCVGRGCHGGIEPLKGDGCRQNEYTTIITSDPHASAYSTLLSDRSQRMAKLLGRADGKAHEMNRCLACHATPSVVADQAAKVSADGMVSQPRRRDAELQFGVGCESCHGAAETWLHGHYSKPPTSKPAALDQPAIRAATCAACHVGDRGSAGFGERNVDHDLIAAGHPRLLFEIVAFNDALPPHWRTKPRDVPLEWFEGQIASAQAALNVLKDRLGDGKAPWPEFAEFDCFACHHDLKEASWRQKVKRRHLGVAPWNSWNTEMILRLLAQHDLPSGAWQKLRSEMESFNGRRPAKLHELVQDAQESLGSLSKKGTEEWSQAKGRDNLRQFLKQYDRMPVDSWEAAEQYYFAVRALSAATGDADVARRLQEMESARGFDPAFVSPRNFLPGEFSNRRPLP